ncbi:MAG: putative lipid II flippase FtsW [bacterium]|nr:putative lipid II flippase FtsW [bacterium]
MKKIDYVLLSAVIIISIFGLIMIYSSSYIWSEYKFNDAYKYVKMQGLFFIIGLIIMYIVSKINYQIYKKYATTILIISIVLLILVAIPGIGSVRNGSRSWFGIGSFGIQPSEATKIAITIFTAKYLNKNQKLMTNTKKGVLPILSVLMLLFGLIMLQPDFGTATVMVMSIIVLLLIGGVKFNFFAKIGIVGIVGVIGLILAAPYRMKRIISFINPWADPLGSGFQIIQSLYAIGPGGLLGFGFGNSIQKHFYLPEPQTDFIFSIISEEFGFLGVIIVAGLFLTIIYRGIKVALNQTDLFGKFLSFGITFSLAFQTLLNLMVVVGLIPVTGVAFFWEKKSNVS